MTTFDTARAKQVLEHIKTAFESLERLIDHYETLLKQKYPDKTVLQKILNTLRMLKEIEQQELNREARGSLETLVTYQKEQLVDLVIMERAVQRLEKDPLQKGEIKTQAARFLLLLTDELRKLR